MKLAPHIPLVLLLSVGCAYRWGGVNPSASTSPLLVNPPLVENLSGVPGLDERFLEAFLAAAGEYPELRVLAGASAVNVTVVVRRAGSDILVKDDLDRVVEARRWLVADVAVGGAPPVRVDTSRTSAAFGLELRRRPGAAVLAQDDAVFALARAVADFLVAGGER
ncbi:MAG TPA: hypothetical protein ENN09_05925 [Planctomycetes bacterium]|nr:hypothetical protein [Planctomycetota bacterium]